MGIVLKFKFLNNNRQEKQRGCKKCDNKRICLQKKISLDVANVLHERRIGHATTVFWNSTYRNLLLVYHDHGGKLSGKQKLSEHT